MIDEAGILSLKKDLVISYERKFGTCLVRTVSDFEQGDFFVPYVVIKSEDDDFYRIGTMNIASIQNIMEHGTLIENDEDIINELEKANG